MLLDPLLFDPLPPPLLFESLLLEVEEGSRGLTVGEDPWFPLLPDLSFFPLFPPLLVDFPFLESFSRGRTVGEEGSRGLTVGDDPWPSSLLPFLSFLYFLLFLFFLLFLDESDGGRVEGLVGESVILRGLVGELVGKGVGASVGASVGAVVGRSDGLSLGSRLLDGEAVGSRDGK